MCRLCEEKPVYEFTNKRKLCARCFINYLQKKALYIIRKFGMIRQGDIIGYENKGDFREAVLEDILKMFSEKADISIVNSKLTSSSFSSKKSVNRMTTLSARKSDRVDFKAYQSRAKRDKIKIALPNTLDIEADKLVHILAKGHAEELKKLAPVEGKVIKPLYLFLDEEVLLYAKLRNLKFRKIKEKKDKLSEFINDLEKKHPEIKRAIVNSYLELY